MPRFILLIGGNSGIGLATAKRLQEKECRVLAASRHQDQLAALGIASQPFEATDADPALDLPDSLDGFVYFPGTITLKPFPRLTDSDFLDDFQVNVLGATRALRLALPALKKAPAASVVLFSTVAVGTGMSFHASIAAAKGAIEGLTRSLAAEWAPGIRVNCIAPSLTETPLAASFLGDEKRREASRQRHPLKALGRPEEVAELVDYLLSDASRFTTGQVFRPDGGLSSIYQL